MTERIILAGRSQRVYAQRMIEAATPMAVVTIRERTRSDEQNAMFHALCSDIAKSKFPWFGKPRSAEEWKVLLVSGHTKATKGEVEVVPGIEGELVNIRESTARMSVARANSLMEYVLAFCAENGIEVREPKKSEAA